MATRIEAGTPFSGVRPSGTVTFLFSDVEGSTERWERDREAMSAALARHDALMRAALEARGGYVFKTMGDAFCCAFFTATDAMAAALDAQRAIGSENFDEVSGLRVRMALHTGAGDERGGDYFGPAVNRVARLLAIGHGGQVLVSGTSADLLQGEMPAQSSLRDLGAHRLKDLARPEQVYQLVAPDLPQAFPALRSLDELPNNLPRQLTSFVGREQVIADVAALLKKFPLVTLVGTGGAGKTRCAIQIGAELLDGSGDGVWLAELAPISDPAHVSNVIALALHLEGQPDRPVLEALVSYLKRKRLMLILDNCEHVIDETRRVVAAILHECPDVRVLATSREGLNIAGEEVYRVPSLAVPRENIHSGAQESSRYEAVQLFVDRALSVDKRFTLSEQNAADIMEICSRLDGIPLAIELAAARVKVLSPKQLAQKLDERFRLLTGGDRSAMPRQQTMRALIDWSYDLLSDDERTLFRALSIFAGGFTLESAAAVCSSEFLDEMAVLDLLTSLVDKSLVQAELIADGTRYRLLESTRDYAREKLTERGEYPAVAQAHAEAFLALAEKMELLYETMPDRAWRIQVDPEMENWRAALEWSLTSRGDVALARRLVVAMRLMWTRFGASEGRVWVRAALAAIDDATPETTIGRLHLVDAALDDSLVQRRAALEASRRAFEILDRCGDPFAIRAQIVAGGALIFLDCISEGETLLRSALQSIEETGPQKLKSQALLSLATARLLADDISGARALFAQARAIGRAAGNAQMVLDLNLAECEFRGGNIEAAVQLGNDALAEARAQGIYASTIAITLTNLAAYFVALGRFGEARDCGRKAVTRSRDLHRPVLMLFALQHLAAVTLLSTEGDDDAARKMRTLAAHALGHIDARLTELEAAREYTEQQEYDKMTAILAAAFGEDGAAKLMAEGAAWSEDQVVADAMTM